MTSMTEILYIVAVPIFFVLFFVVVLGIVNWMAQRQDNAYLKKEEQLKERGYPAVDSQLAIRTELGILNQEVKIKTFKGDQKRFSLTLRLPWENKNVMYLARETKSDMVIRSLGLSRESILGNKDVDRLFHVVLNNENEWKSLLSTPELTNVLIRLGEQMGFQRLVVSSSELIYEVSNIIVPPGKMFEEYVQELRRLFGLFGERVQATFKGIPSPATKAFEKKFEFFGSHWAIVLAQTMVIGLSILNYLINFSWIRPIYMLDVYILIGLPSLVFCIGVLFLNRRWIQSWQLPAKTFFSLVVANLVSASLILFSIVIFLDIGLDREKAQTMALPVKDKTMTIRRSRSGHKKHYFLYYQSPIEPILINTSEIEVSVSESEYDGTKVGRDARKFTFHRGLFGIPWYEY